MSVTPAQPRPRFETVPDALKQHARSAGATLALTDGTDHLSYLELAHLTEAAAARMSRLGVEAGQRVAILGENSVDWVVAFLGCLRLGAVAVPLNYRLSVTELAAQLVLTEPALVLADEDAAPVAERAAAGGGRPVRSLSRDGGGRLSLWRQAPAEQDFPAPGADAIALISFTSGSTGTPKGALISHGALVAAGDAYVRVLGTGPHDRTLVMVPLFHNTGFCDQLVQMLLVGGTVDVIRRFGVRSAIAALVERPATYLIAVPGILRLLTLDPAADGIFGSCRIGCYGGSPMPEAWIHEIAERWPRLRLFNCYGLTEFTSASHILRPEELDEHSDTVGRPVPGAAQKLVDEDGVETAGPGLLLLSGPSRMSGYWRSPEATRAALRDGWLVTGDVGTVTADGFLRLLGRASEVINRGGEKISPMHVESALSLTAEVAECAVLGAPHPVFGERVVAFVTTKSGTELDLDATRDQLRERVADYAIPEHFFLVDELPRTAAGKVDRQVLKREAEHVFGMERT